MGMTLALRLAQNGLDVTLIEASERTGGLASPYQIGPYTWDQFYHVILMSDSHLLNLLAELNLADQINWSTAKSGFFTDGRLYSMSNVIEFLTFPPLNLLDKLRLGWTIFYASRIRSWKRLEKISVTKWLTRLSGKRTFKKIWLPLLKSKLGENYRLTSASFIWAIIARMYAARRSELKQEKFGYVDGGYNKILDHFQTHLNKVGVNTLYNTRINRVDNNGEYIELKTNITKRLQLDVLIMTIPTIQIPEICPELIPEEKRRLSSVIYEGVICLALILKRPLSGYYITNITEDWIPFTAVIEMTSILDNKYFDGNSLIYLPLYLNHDDSFFKKTDEEIKDLFVKALGSMYPSFSKDDILFSKISRASHVLPITTLNYSTEVIPSTYTSFKNMFIVNSAQIANGTMNVNEIVGLANRKAKEIVTHLLNL